MNALQTIVRKRQRNHNFGKSTVGMGLLEPGKIVKDFKMSKTKTTQNECVGLDPSKLSPMFIISELFSQSANGRKLIIMQMILVHGNANGCGQWNAIDAPP